MKTVSVPSSASSSVAPINGLTGREVRRRVSTGIDSGQR